MSEKMPFMLLVRRIFFYTIVVLVVTAAVLLSIARLFISDVETYRLDIEQFASAFLDHPVKIDSMDARFVGLTPTLVFDNVRMLDVQGKRELISFKEARLGISVMESLRTEKVVPGKLVIEGVNFVITRQQDGQINIQGIDFNKFSLQPEAESETSSEELSDWLFRRSRLAVRDGTIIWNDYKEGVSRRFDDVNLHLANDENQHHLKGNISLPEEFGRNIELALSVSGDMLQPESWQGDVYLHGDGVHLDAWENALPLEDINVSDGILDLYLWASLDKGHLTRVSGDVTLSALAMDAKFLARPLSFDIAGAVFDYRAHDKGWSIDVDRLQFRSGESIWPVSRLHARQAMQENGAPDQFALVAEYIPLGDLSSLLIKTELLPDDIQKFLAKAQPSGEIRNLVLSTSTHKDILNGPYQIQAQLINLSLKADGHRPGFSNISGTLWADEQHGRMTLVTGESELNFPTVFRSPLKLEKLVGDLYWQKEAAGLQVWSDKLDADTPHIRTSSQVLLDVPTDQSSPYLDLQVAFQDGNGKYASVYVPVGIMDPGLVKWLDSAIKGGHVIDGGAIFNGRLTDFPFNKENGQFRVVFNGENINLKYGEGWPEITRAKASAIFTAKGVTVDVESGRLMGSTISRADVRIPSFIAGILEVDGIVKGAVKDAAHFLVDSPIAPDAKDFVHSARIDGQAVTSLKLKLPLSKKVAATSPETYSGIIKIKDGGLYLYDEMFDITALNGEINYSEQGLAARNVSGLLLGQKANVDIFTQKDTEGMDTRIVMDSSLNAMELQQRFAVTKDRVHGKAGIQGVLSLGHDKDGKTRPPLVRLTSDFQGMSLDLPAPIIKSADEKRDLGVEIDFANMEHATLRLNYANQLSTALVLKPEAIDRVAVHFGSGIAELPKDKSIHITGSAHNFIVSDWRSTLGQLGTADGKAALSVPVVIDMDVLDIGQVADSESDIVTTLDVDDVPPMRGKIKKLVYDGIPVGSVSFQTSRILNGLQIDWLDLNGHHWSMHATGDWKKTIIGEKTSLDITVSSSDTGNALKDLGYAVVIKDGVMQGSARVNWPGAPGQFDMERIKGSLHLNIQKGSFTDVDAGAGRLLGLFSLSALPRRLILDFRDTFKEGFSFDEMNGDFKLRDGNSITENLMIKSPAAIVTITGRVGLVDQDFDEVMTVVPQFGGTLPVAGSLVFGLEVGAVIILLDQLLGKEINKANMRQYAITGSWENPVITKITRERPNDFNVDEEN